MRVFQILNSIMSGIITKTINKILPTRKYHAESDYIIKYVFIINWVKKKWMFGDFLLMFRNYFKIGIGLNFTSYFILIPIQDK